MYLNIIPMRIFCKHIEAFINSSANTLKRYPKNNRIVMQKEEYSQ